MKGTTYIIGLGVAGLSTAVRLVENGHSVALFDGAKVAGGRCRSFHDSKLDCLIDNGNHLLLSGNKSAISYLDLLGARDELQIANEATFPFFDLENHQRWSVEMNAGAIPLWIFDRKKTVPGVRMSEYLSTLKFPFASADNTISDLTNEHGQLFKRFWEPMTWAVLNTTPDRASAQLMWAVFRETFAKGGSACCPMIARRGLSETFVNPALRYLETARVAPTFACPLKHVEIRDGQISTLHLGERAILLSPDDRVVFALPRVQVGKFLPDIMIPDGDAAIVNAHFRLAHPLSKEHAIPFIGLINAKAHWIFTRDNIISLTISAADALGLDRISEEDLLPELWSEVIMALKLPDTASYEAGRLIRERRATFDQSPDSVKRRPKTQSVFKNLVLAGDWVDTSLPATIEGSIRSGEMAAKVLTS